MENGSQTTFLFGDFELSGAKRLLLKRGETLSLNSRTFDLLLVLLEHHGQIVHKDELLDKVWEGQFVEENNLTVQISALRKIFGEKKGEHRFIATIPGKGYKFVADVVRVPFASREPETLNNSVVSPAVSTISAPPLGLETALIGREREIAQIEDLLRQSGVNLITLTGAGGSGKTALARSLAGLLKADFADGVFFVEIAAATETNLVAAAIAQALEITEASNRSLVETIKEFFRTRKILLILDNFEQVLSAAPLVNELLAESPKLKILITSRAALRLAPEREFIVLPLDLPPAELAFSVEKLTEFPAVALFCRRAQAVRSNFALTGENAVPVAAICRRLDGLPLAIELAAVRVNLLSPQSISDRLENSLNLLTGGARDLPLRQRTMRGAIGWSYDLLCEDEQLLFRRLAVFAGGFSAEAAESVVSRPLFAAEENSQSKDVFNLLDALIDNNLLVSTEQTDGNARLRMLEVVREFALESLENSGEAESMRRVHADFFLALVEQAQPLLNGEKGNEWLEKLETEHDNLRSALSWSLKNDGETAARIAAALRFFWLNRSHLSEGLSWSQAALQASENRVSGARSALLLSNGVFLRTQGDFEAARKVYEETLAESREVNDLLQIIKANHGLAAITVLQKDFVAAQEFIEEALAISRQLKDETQTAYSLCSLGDLEMSRENLSAARPLLEECLALSKNLGNNKLLTTNFFNLGTIDFLEGSYETAALNFTESLRIAAEMGNKTMISCALEGFAALALKGKTPELSARLAGAAEGLRESMGYKLEPAEEIFRADYLTKARAALGEKRFAALYREGSAMTPDEAAALAFSQNLPEKPEFDAEENEPIDEIIIETRKIERITIDEEFEPEKPSESPTKSLPQISAKQNFRRPFFVFSIIALAIAAAIFGYWLWS